MIKAWKHIWVARFGRGTVSMTPYEPVPGFHILDLSTCEKSPIGTDTLGDSKVTEYPKIRLRFDNIESITALMSKLQDIKELMMGMPDDKSTTGIEKESDRVCEDENRNTPSGTVSPTDN